MPLLKPRALRPGSRIGLVAPAGVLLDGDDLHRGEELCRALGYEPVLGPNAGRRYGYLAGTDDQRLADLNGALTDPSLDAVWCLRGGVGATRILPRVMLDAVRTAPKLVIGYSDITVLLNALHRRTGLVTFHGPIARASMTPFARWHFDRVTTSISAAGRLGRIAPPADELVPTKGRIVTIRGGVAEGPIVGGNLTLLQCLVGTPWFPDLNGAILFIEDVGEATYRIDRMLSHLRSVGAFDRLAGVMAGRFTEMDLGTDDGAIGLEEVLTTYFGDLGIPVAHGFPIGHIDDQWTLPLGVRTRLDTDAGEVELLESAVGA